MNTQPLGVLQLPMRCYRGVRMLNGAIGLSWALSHVLSQHSAEK